MKKRAITLFVLAVVASATTFVVVKSLRPVPPSAASETPPLENAVSASSVASGDINRSSSAGPPSPGIQAPPVASPNRPTPSPVRAEQSVNSVGGFAFPDLGDGNPFEHIGLTSAEADELFSLFMEFMERQKEIDDQVARGELSALEAVDQLGDVQLELGKQVETLLGDERSVALAEALATWNADAAERMAKGDDIPGATEAADSPLVEESLRIRTSPPL